MSILFAHFVYLLYYSYKECSTFTLLAAISCGPAPSAPANGRKIGSGKSFGSTVTYTCETGYTLQGDKSSTCMANGQWSVKTSTCNRKLHTVLFLPVHGHQKSIKAMILQCDDSWGSPVPSLQLSAVVQPLMLLQMVNKMALVQPLGQQ